MFYERTEDGSYELNDAGALMTLIFVGTFLAGVFAILRSLNPTINPNSSGFVGMFILIPAQLGSDESWIFRVRILAYAFIGYAWCVSLARILVGGDMVLYVWGSLLIFTTILQWLWMDAKKRRKDEAAG
jgi:hypothetical protein